MISHVPCLPRCDHHVQDVIALSAMTQMPNIHYYTLLHITTHYLCPLLHITIYYCIHHIHWTLYACQNHGKPSVVQSVSTRHFLERRWSRVYVLPITSILGRLPGLEILGPSRLAITMAVATAPIATTTTSQTLIQAEGLETAARCTLWILVCWAGPATPEVQWSAATAACDSLTFVITHYYTLYCIFTFTQPLLHIITLIIKHHYISYYYTLLQNHHLVLFHHYFVIIIITSSLHHHYIIITSSLHHYYIHFIKLLLHYHYVLLHWLSLLIIIKSLLHIITSLLHNYYIVLHHCYIIITNGKSWDNDYIITCNATSKRLLLQLLSIIMSLLHRILLLRIATYFSLQNLQMKSQVLILTFRRSMICWMRIWQRELWRENILFSTMPKDMMCIHDDILCSQGHEPQTSLLWCLIFSVFLRN